MKLVAKPKRPERMKNGRHYPDVPVVYRESGMPIYGYNDNGVPCCYARTPRGRCRSVALIFPAGRCRKHGGNVKPSIAGTGPMSNSKYANAPLHVREKMEQYLLRDDFLSLNEDIAFADTRIAELVSDLQGLDSAAIEHLDDLAQSILSLMERGKPYQHKVHALILEIGRCRKKSDKYAEVQKAQEARRKLTETEASIVAKKDMQIPASRAILLFDRQSMIFQQEVEKLIPAELRSALLISVSERIESELLPSKAIPIPERLE